MNRSNYSTTRAESLATKLALLIPEDELIFAAARASGPGGQNVNKVETKIRLSFDFRSSRALSDVQKEILSRSKIIQDLCNSEGCIVITVQEHRSQGLNKAEAQRKLINLISTALKPVRKRIKTRPTLASRRRRLESKTRRGITKKLRRGRAD